MPRRRPRTTPTASSTASSSTPSAAPDRDDAGVLLDLIGVLEPFTLVALGPPVGRGRRSDRHVAVRPLAPDPRSGAACLFGIRAPRGSPAIALSLLGAGRPIECHPDLTDPSGGRPAPGAHPDPALLDGTTLRIDLVLDRRSGHRSRIRAEGADPLDGVLEEDTGAGLVLDAMHRVLDLPAPGAPPPCRDAVVGLWSHHLLAVLELDVPVSWAIAAALHPAAPAGAHTPPSPEVLADAGPRFESGRTWSDLRALAVAGDLLAPDLSAEEAAWMDTTMFARWWAQSVPPPSLVVQALRATGSGALEGYRQVVGGRSEPGSERS